MTMTEAPVTPVQPKYRFAVASRERFKGSFKEFTQAFGTTLETVDIPAGDFTEGIYLQVSATAAGNAAAVAFQADGPFAGIQEVQLLDPQGIPFQIISGYELFAWNLVGGFVGNTDATLSPYYTAVTGAGATGGSFSYFLYLPGSLFPRELIAALFNGSSASQFKVRIVYAASSAVYATPPTAVPQMRTRYHSHGVQLAQQLPSGRAYEAEPPGGQVYNNLTRQVYQFSGAGNITVPLTRKGFLYRQLLFIWRTAAGVRSDAICTDAVFSIDGVDHFAGPYELWKHLAWERGSHGTTGANFPAGLTMQSFCHDWDGNTGNETKDFYVPSSPGSIVEGRFVVTAAGSLTILVNDVVPTEESIRSGLFKV